MHRIFGSVLQKGQGLSVEGGNSCIGYLAPCSKKGKDVLSRVALDA